jgi:hypothetical protein
MRATTVIRTMNTACGKEITYLQETGQIAKAHSATGPAIVYPKQDKKTPDYYLFGIKYSKAVWQDLVNQTKASPSTDGIRLDF